MTILQLWGWLALIAVVMTGALMWIGKRREPEDVRDVPKTVNPGAISIRKYDFDDPTDTGRFFAVLYADNGKEVARSERYANKSSAWNWAKRLKIWADTDDVKEQLSPPVGPDEATSGRQ